MRTFLTTPAWALGLLAGVPVAVVTAIIVAVSGDTFTFALTLGATVGLLFGIAMALGAVRQRRDLRPIFDLLPPADWDLARTAARRGPAPTDPAVRAAAVELVDLRLRDAHRVRTTVAIVYGLALAATLLNIAFGHWWYIPLALMLTAGLAMQWSTPRRLQQRRELLAAN